MLSHSSDIIAILSMRALPYDIDAGLRSYCRILFRFNLSAMDH